jgi:CHAD domain-containing protein
MDTLLFSEEGSTTETDPLTVKTFALQAIEKHFHKATRYEAEVLCDQDPEPLHQMRVGLRRLRTALTVFAPFILLPRTLSRCISTISQPLGAVRDLDVLGLWFAEYQANRPFSAAESSQLEVVLQRLSQRRQKRFKRMIKLLDSKLYRHFTEECQTWVSQPKFKGGAAWPIRLVLPDLLSPLIHRLLLHPGWLSAWPTESAGDEAVPLTLTSSSAPLYFAVNGAVLHDLRKQMKRVRYQTEFFASFYGPDYAAQIHEFKAIQDLLGEWQDGVVLDRFLTGILDECWPQVLPTLHEYMQQQQQQRWQQWQPIQQKYLSAEFRARLRWLMGQVEPTAMPISV